MKITTSASSVALVVALLLAAGCATVDVAPTPNLLVASTGASAELDAAVEGFYQARTPEELRSRVQQALQLAPHHPASHEIAAHLAELEDKPAERFRHLLAASAFQDDPAAALHLRLLLGHSFTRSEHAEAMRLLESIVRDHPDPEVRGLAAFGLAEARHRTGDLSGAEQLGPQLGLRLPVAVIGPWDNDQGKGFEIEQAPEREIQLDQRYPGAIREVGWRADVTPDRIGSTIHLGYQIQPAARNVAYAVAAFKAPEVGPVEVRLGANAPVKVWVNEALVFANPRQDGDLHFDTIVVPVEARRGHNRVLIKIAQRDVDGAFALRLTGPGGAALGAGFEAAPPGTPPDGGAAPGPALDEAAMVQRLVRALPEGSARRRALTSHAARWLGASVLRVELAQEGAQHTPDALLTRYEQARALWDVGERGRTNDMLSQLSDTWGDELPELRIRYVRFLKQQHLYRKAREQALRVREQHPERTAALDYLADLFATEGWLEDRCEALRERDRLRPGDGSARFELAGCLRAQGYIIQADALIDDILRDYPSYFNALELRYDLALARGDYGLAAASAQRMAAAWPDSPWPWSRLADVQRRMGDATGAEQSLRRFTELLPDAAWGWSKRGALAYEQGKAELAVQLWLEALARDPDNASLGNRIAWLNPLAEGPWVADVPDEDAIQAIVDARAGVQPMPGANIIDLLDHDVTQFNADGSRNSVVTLVRLAVNEAGRDALTLYRLPTSRYRVLLAYAVRGNGERVEASSIRGREIRFRDLDVGSTVVVQLRTDIAPQGFLHGQLATRWMFQDTNVQKRRAEWILWTPRDIELREHRIGAIEVAQREEGDRRRTVYAASDVPPFTEEPWAPDSSEFQWHVAASSVPDWDTFLRWEEALLRDAFRSTPEVNALAEQLAAGTDDPEEKLLRIQTWIVEKIRYQQDYEGFIEGVKPHGAPQVLERRYGDCKDKAVLFLTLARAMGIETHFALIRTRTRGPAIREVPHQQFNHVIVYVPEAKGIRARFFDPTVDALDPDVLRDDDQGSWSFVVDPWNIVGTWREVPWQPAELDTTHTAMTLQLEPGGAATGTVAVDAHGRGAQLLRRAARNARRFLRVVQSDLNESLDGATAQDVQPVEVSDLRKPASIRYTFKAPAVGRREDRELRMKIPARFEPLKRFSVADRRLPLDLDRPHTLSWTVEIELPQGARVKRLPASTRVGDECLSLERKARADGTRVVVEQTWRVLCGRIEPDAYEAHRSAAVEVKRLLDEDLVITLPR